VILGARSVILVPVVREWPDPSRPLQLTAITSSAAGACWVTSNFIQLAE